jgi:hypothetical protein
MDPIQLAGYPKNKKKEKMGEDKIKARRNLTSSFFEIDGW